MLTSRGGMFAMAITLGALAGMPTLARAAVIDFTGITPATVDTPYNDPSGYTIASDTADKLVFSDVGGGNIALRNNNWGRAIILTKTDNSLFNLVSFDYSGDPWAGFADATVTGTLGDNSTVLSSIGTGGNAYKTLVLNWSNLKSVEIGYNGGTNNAYGMLDNFVVSSDAAVPEPASLGLLALGGLTLLRRRR